MELFNRYVNKQRLQRLLLVAVAINVCFLLSGCTSAWISTVGNLLPGISSLVSAIVAFVASLQGKTVSADFYAAIQKWQTNIEDEITNVQTILAQIKQSATSGLLSEFEAGMQAIQQSFNSILNGVNITDSATVAKLTQFLSLGIAAINAVLALIPMAVSKIESKAGAEEMKHYDEVAGTATGKAVNTMRETYVAIREAKTENADVNAALDSMPAGI